MNIQNFIGRTAIAIAVSQMVAPAIQQMVTASAEKTASPTLSKAITSTFFKNEDGFEKLQERWKTAVKSGEFKPKSNELLVYSILRGKDWRKCFSPLKRETKLVDGTRYYAGAIEALQCLGAVFYNSPLFDDLLVENALHLIYEVLDLSVIPTKIYRENPMSLEEFSYQIPRQAENAQENP